MTLSNRAVRAVLLLLASAVIVAAVVPAVYAQDAASGQAERSITPLLQKMAGTWDVRQRMWTGPDAEPVDLPSAVAQRHLVAGAYLQEVMGPAEGSGGGAFVRTAYINYNPVTRRYEYFSVDSRAPQQMHYQSDPMDKLQQEAVKLKGGVFVAPKWGQATNVAFKYRLVLGEVKNDRQEVRLYLTPQSGETPQEFLAFEYVYTRRR